MAEKKYTQEELIEIGRKVIEVREKQRAAGRERRRVKNALYKAYTEGKLGNLKV